MTQAGVVQSNCSRMIQKTTVNANIAWSSSALQAYLVLAVEQVFIKTTRHLIDRNVDTRQCSRHPLTVCNSGKIV